MFRGTVILSNPVQEEMRASLARLGNKVVLVDAELGGSNLHTFVGIRYPAYTLADFISKKVETINGVLISSPVDNMKIICGADGILGMANPKYAQKTRLLNHLKKLDADFILPDLGAGTSFATIDFFLYAPNKIVVLTPPDHIRTKCIWVYQIQSLPSPERCIRQG